MQSDLRIIILNYNTWNWMEKVLHSIEVQLLQNTSLSVEVVVADNGSDDDSVKKIKRYFRWAKVIENKKNFGFAGGNNPALKSALSRYVMLLNSDTEFLPETHLEKMIAYMDEHPDVAVMTPRLELSDGKLDLASHRGEPTPWASFCYFSKLSKLFPKSKLFAQYHQTYKDFSSIHEVDACSGAAMIVRTATMKEVGYLDDRFFMYAEDLDWCKRFRDAGYKIVYFPESKILHHKYKSGRKNKNSQLAKKTNRFFYQTMLQYYDKHYQNTYPRIIRWLIQVFIQLKVNS